MTYRTIRLNGFQWNSSHVVFGEHRLIEIFRHTTEARSSVVAWHRERAASHRYRLTDEMNQITNLWMLLISNRSLYGKE